MHLLPLHRRLSLLSSDRAGGQKSDKNRTRIGQGSDKNRTNRTSALHARVGHDRTSEGPSLPPPGRLCRTILLFFFCGEMCWLGRARAHFFLLLLWSVLLAPTCVGAPTNEERGISLVAAAGADGLSFTAYVHEMESRDVATLTYGEKDRLLKAFRRLGAQSGRQEGRGTNSRVFAGTPLLLYLATALGRFCMHL